MKPKIQLFHFTRIPGCNKMNNSLREFNNFIAAAAGKFSLFNYFLTHYQYKDETGPMIRRKALVILIPCNNCNEHKVDPENCEFILDSENRIFGFSFKITNKKESKTNYIVDNGLFESIQKEIVKKWQIIFYYTKEKFCQKYEISKEFDFNYITPYNFLDYPPIWGPHSASKKTIYLSIFCPVSEKEIQLRIKNITEQVTIKYGWTMFCVCLKYCLDLSQWSVCTTQKPNEITQVSCNKPNFNMYILNNNRVPMSLFNLSLSSLYQNKLNSALNLTNYVVPKIVSQQAPPCYLFHLCPATLRKERHDRCHCCGFHFSSHISDW